MISVPGSINTRVVEYRNRVSSPMEVVIEPWLFARMASGTIDDEACSVTKETVEQFAYSEATLIIITIVEIPNKDVSYKFSVTCKQHV